VSAYSINRLTGDLTLLNTVAAVGAPAYVSVDNSGKYLFAAEYSGATFEAFPILGDGSLGPAVFSQFDADNVGPKIPASGPPGNANFSAHEGPNGHPHQMEADPSNQWVIGPDAGQDRIYVWNLTVGNAPPLTPAAVPFVTVPPGHGARHFAFHPNGVWMYSIQEEGDTIIFWQFNPATGSLTNQQQVSSLPPGYAGTTFTSEIRVSPNGRFVYGLNRLNDTITVFTIGADGRLTQTSYASTLGDYPRIITIDPLGMYMVCANQRADNLTSFKIATDGSLTFTGYYTPVGSPSGMVFLI
jgi:6-phosphogluconolactonase (cycloisomerase 2 family)